MQWVCVCLFMAGTGWLCLVGTGCATGGEAPVPGSEAISVALIEANYVGDEACADCHEALYQSYHRTGMGRSVSRFELKTAPEQFGPQARIYDPKLDLYYEPFVRHDTLFQREFRMDEAGNIIYEQTHPVEWVIGSGNATRSYMMEVSGIVTEMPLTWYVDKARWDLSPAYAQKNLRFSRPIVAECLTCHDGRPEHTPFTQAHYTEVPLGITCERCHGPGSRHVDDRLSGFAPASGEPDPTIINPATLGRDEHLAVCQQCHLTGITVFKPGEDATTYRPGTPLAAHRAVFVLREERDDPERFGIASHADRLALSACYQESAMTCVTCHDPHQPVADLEENHINQVCQSCHTPADSSSNELVCSRDARHNAAEAMAGDCVNCHLQKSGTTDIPHVTFTDHWIRRIVPPSREPEAIERNLTRPVPFDLVRMTDEPEEEGIALLEEASAIFSLYETRHRLPVYLDRVITKARQGLAAGADHPDARLALGRALMEADSVSRALPVFEAAVRAYPEDARMYLWLGIARLEAGQARMAAEVLEQATAIQPRFVEAWQKLAEASLQSGQADRAEAAFLTVLEQDPIHRPETWNDLGILYLEQKQIAEAQSRFERAIDLDPNFVVALVNLGSVHLIKQDLNQAATLFERALEMDASNTAALGNLGLIYAQREEYDRARSMLQAMLALTPGDQRARAVLEQIEQLANSRTN